MTDDLFSVSVPDSDLEAPAFTLMPAGSYRTTLQSGAELVANNAGWKAIRLPFQGFRDVKTPGREFQRSLRAQLTYESSNAKAVEIGTRDIISAAAAFGLTEPTVTNDGKPGQKLTASSMEELVDQFNQMAGTEVEVYLSSGPRKKHGIPAMKADGVTPWLDNEIKRISAIKVA